MMNGTRVKRGSGRRHHSCPRRSVQPWRALTLLMAALLAGCGNVPVGGDAQPARLGPSLDAERALGIERAYRGAYRLLDECFALAPYRVRGVLSRDRLHGELSVDRGVGLEQTLFLRTGLYLTVKLTADGPARTRLSIRTAGADMDAYARGLLARLDDPKAACKG